MSLTNPSMTRTVVGKAPLARDHFSQTSVPNPANVRASSTPAFLNIAADVATPSSWGR